MKRLFIIPILVLFSNSYALCQKSILSENRLLLKALSKFTNVYEVNYDYIQFQTKEVSKINFGFGVALKKTGKVIYPATTKTSSFISVHGDYIILSKGDNLSHRRYGMINSTGKKVLDFKYEHIGSVFVPLPDSLITVQIGDKFGVFNTKTKKLSPIIYNNSVNWLNDGYNYHEGGAREANRNIYSQLGLKNYKQPNTISTTYNNKTRINNSIEKEQYLTTKNNTVLSKKYNYIKRLLLFDKSTYFIAINFKPRKTYLLNENGEEISEIYSEHPNYTVDYIKINDSNYLFTANQNIITIPNEYRTFVICYADIGILGFTNYNTGKKLFIDKLGNMLNENQL